VAKQRQDEAEQSDGWETTGMKVPAKKHTQRKFDKQPYKTPQPRVEGDDAKPYEKREFDQKPYEKRD
jgi:hypothetical protein